MHTTPYTVPPKLKALIKGVRFLHHTATDQQAHHMPYFADGYPGIMYLESGNDVLLNRDEKLGSLFLYGQTIRPIEILARGSCNTIIVFLAPQAVRTLFGIQAYHLRDGCLDFDLMHFQGARHLKDQIREAPDLFAKADKLCGFITQLAQRYATDPDANVHFAAQELLTTRGHTALRDLQTELRISERSFERRFKEYVGISPRLFARICKFQSALQQLESSEYAKLSDVAYDHHYSDQSHFIRTFREFTGMTPSEYREARLHPG